MPLKIGFGVHTNAVLNLILVIIGSGIIYNTMKLH